MPKKPYYFLDILKAASPKIFGVKIWSFKRKKIKTTLTLLQNEAVKEIDIDFTEAIKIAQNLNIPIFAHETIVEKFGVTVTEEMLEKALIS